MKKKNIKTIKKFMIKVMVLFSALIGTQAYATTECLFEGTVHPSEKTEIVKDIYQTTCLFFVKKFSIQLNPEIKLNNVFFVEDWNNVDFINYKDDSLHAVFYSPIDLSVNDIYIKWNPEFISQDFNLLFDEDAEIIESSIIAHEIVHFLFKSSNFEYRKRNGIVVKNFTMEETLAYWFQNEYIKIKTGNNLMDYISTNISEFKTYDDEGFVEVAILLYQMAWDRFVHSSIDFINRNTTEKYKNILDNKYIPPNLWEESIHEEFPGTGRSLN